MRVSVTITDPFLIEAIPRTMASGLMRVVTHHRALLMSVERFDGHVGIENPRLAQMLRDFYKDALTEGHLRMALVPEGADLVTSETTQEAVMQLAAVDEGLA